MPVAHHSVHALARGLAVMEAVGQLGKASAAQVAIATAIPRPSVYRLLETLCELGYVQREGRRDGYSLALRLRALASACRETDWLAEIAEPYLTRLANEVVWPCDIATYQDGGMVIRATTHGRSPLSLERIASGRFVPMLTTATGRTYLAFCGPVERQAIVDALGGAGLSARDDMGHPLLLRRELEATRKRGYGVRRRGAQPKTSSIAAPVLAGEQLVACININWIDSAAGMASIIERHLAPLQAAARGIGDAYAAALRQPCALVTHRLSP